MSPLRILLLLLASLIAVSAEAAIYKCVDSAGRTTYSDSKCAGKRSVFDPEPDAAPGSSSPTASGSPRVRTPRVATPPDFPRVDSATQKRRDDLRGRILQDELASEKRNVEAARQQLAQGRKLLPGERANAPTYQERVKRLRDSLTRHEQNVASIQRELANLR